MSKFQLYEKSAFLCKKENVLKAISYENILVAFLILPAGMFLSILMLTMEKFRRQKNLVTKLK